MILNAIPFGFRIVYDYNLLLSVALFFCLSCLLVTCSWKVGVAL